MSNFNDFQRQNINPVDISLMGEEDPNFDLEHNKRVIQSTIEQAKRMQRTKQREYGEQIKERSWAATHFIDQVKSGGEANVEKFFGKSYLNYLKGQQIAEKYKMAWTDAKKKEESKTAFIQKVKSTGNM